MFGRKKCTKQEEREGVIELYESMAYKERDDGFEFMPKILDYAVLVLKETNIDPQKVQQFVVDVEKARRQTPLIERIVDDVKKEK